MKNSDYFQQHLMPVKRELWIKPFTRYSTIILFMLSTCISLPTGFTQEPNQRDSDQAKTQESNGSEKKVNEDNIQEKETVNQTVPKPTKEDIGSAPPQIKEIYPDSKLVKEQKKCKKNKGKWVSTAQGLQGCLIKKKREGTWIIKEGNFIQAVIDFEGNQVSGNMWGFNLSGQAIEQIQFKKGQKEGFHRKWANGGQLKLSQRFQAGELEGVSFAWHAKRCIPAHRGRYKAGKKEGPWTTWYPTGAPEEKGNYKDNIKVGKWSFYHKEGNKIREGMMVNGLEEGEWQEWLHTGQKWKKSTYVKGVRQGKDELACVAENGTWQVDHKERTEGCLRYGFETIIRNKFYYETGTLKRSETYNLKGQQTGEVIEYHPTGEVLMKGMWVNGMPNGTVTYLTRAGEPMGPSSHIESGSGSWTAYHHTGKVAEKGRFLLGRKIEKWETYYDHGALESVTPFSAEGYREGEFKRFYRDGTIEANGRFKTNARNGLWKFYYTNGQVAVEVEFKDSARSGIWREWYWLSSPKVEGKYQNNQRVGEWKEFHNNGNVSNRGRYKGDQKDGIWKQNWYTGSSWRDLEYIGGVSTDVDEAACSSLMGEWQADLKERFAGCQVCRVQDESGQKNVKMGTWRWWHPNGELERAGQFLEDKAHGSWHEYNRQGKLTLSGEYEYGKRVGIWKGFYPNGHVQYQGSFDENGGETGEWMTYHRKGGIESRGLYREGHKIGLWAWWHKQGSLAQIGRYLANKGTKPNLNQKVQTKPETDLQDGSTVKAKEDEPTEEKKVTQTEFRSGLWLSWHKGCILKTYGFYENGEREGLWQWWSKGGQGWRSETYHIGKGKRVDDPPPSLNKSQQQELQSFCKKINAKKPLTQDILLPKLALEKKSVDTSTEKPEVKPTVP